MMTSFYYVVVGVVSGCGQCVKVGTYELALVIIRGGGGGEVPAWNWYLHHKVQSVSSPDPIAETAEAEG